MSEDSGPGFGIAPETDGRDDRVVVVVGAGLGGMRTTEALRRRGYAGQITLVGAERHLPYDRPPLSKQTLREGHSPPLLRSEEELRALQVDVRLNTRATGLSVDERCVETDGGPIGYDVLVIATGAVPRRVEGVRGSVLRTVDDAAQLRANLGPGSRLAVIGAGLVGCEVAASARQMGIHVSLVDVQPAPAVRVLGPKVGELLARMHIEHGVELRLGVGVTGARDGGLGLTDGTMIDCDVVLEAVGAIPDVGWLTGSRLGLGNGILCDADGRAAPGVFAVGDVANWAGSRDEHWTSACHQADRVAATIVDQPGPVPDVRYWWSDQFDVKLQGLGSPLPDDDVEILFWGAKARPVAVYSRNSRLTGLVGFSAAGAIMRLRVGVADGTDVGDVLARLAS